MAKVKKGTALTGVRNVKARKPKQVTSAKRSAEKAGRRATRPVPRNRPKQKQGAVKAKSKRGVKPPVGRVADAKTRLAPAPVVRVTVRELDPQRKCGAGTSVQLLYRVDETVDGRASAHLVFFDRHGWYCEHGRTCPAVAHARKQSGRFARVS